MNDTIDIMERKCIYYKTSSSSLINIYKYSYIIIIINNLIIIKKSKRKVCKRRRVS